MQTNKVSRLPEMLRQNKDQILSEWMKYQKSTGAARTEYVSEAALKQTCNEFLELFIEGSESGGTDIQNPKWKPAREMLSDLSASRALQGYTPTETSTFVLSLKYPLFSLLRKEIKSADELADEVWSTTILLDSLANVTAEAFIRSREDVIKRQQREMMELSTPVFRLWDKVLAVPLIGTLDSQRTQLIMEALLSQIVETGSKVAILDITGVPTVDTETAQHLIKTVSAARLMGAECIISGIRPQIAQTIVHLGIDILDVTTKATMADAVVEALGQVGWMMSRKHEHEPRANRKSQYDAR